MAGTDKTVKVTLVAVATPYVKGVNDAAGATRKLGSDIDGIGSKAKSMESSTSRAAGALKGMAVAGAAVAGTALVGFLTDSVRAAGDLEQSVGGVDSVFKDTAETIHAFGKDAAEQVGLSTNEFNQLATVTGALLKNKGLEDFTNKTIELTRRAADVSANFGGTAKEAVEAFNAALRGESDPIERYGIGLNEAAVSAELVAQGLDGLTGSALDAAKTQARIDIIMRQSVDSMGAFAREAGTAQGQQQRLTKEWENAKAELGAALLPAITSVTEGLRAGLDVTLAAAHAFEQIPGPLKAAVVGLIAFKLAQDRLTAGGKVVAGTVRSLGEAIQFARLSAERAGGGFAGLSAGFRTLTGSAGAASLAMKGMRGAGSALMGLAGGPWGLAITGLTAALGGYFQAQADARAAAEEFAGTLDTVTGAMTEQSAKLAQEKFFKDFAQTDYTQVSDSLEAAGVAVGDLIAAYQGGPEQVAEFKRNFDEFVASQEAADLRRQGVNVEALGNSYAALGRDMDAGAAIAKVNADTQKKVAAATDDTGDAADKAAPKIEAAAEAQDAMRTAAEQAEEANRSLAESLRELTNNAIDADAANAAYEASVDAANERVTRLAELEKELANADTAEERARVREEMQKYKLTLDETTEAGRENGAALRDLATDAKDAAEANLLNGESVGDVKERMGDARAEFVKFAIKMGASKKEAEELATKYGLTADEVDNIKDSMEALPSKIFSDVIVRVFGLDRLRALSTAIGAIPGLGGFAGVLGAAAALQRADGGYVSGPGTARSDSIPARLSNGEYVIKAAAVQKYGRHMLDDVNQMRFANGGFVSRMPAPSSTPIDYARLASAVSGGPGLVVNIPGADPLATARNAISEWEWRNGG